MLHKPWQIGISGYHDNEISTLSFGERQKSMASTVQLQITYFLLRQVLILYDFIPWLIARYSIPRPVQRQHPRGLWRFDGASSLSLAGLLDVFCWTVLINIRQPTINTFQVNVDDTSFFSRYFFHKVVLIFIKHHKHTKSHAHDRFVGICNEVVCFLFPIFPVANNS